MFESTASRSDFESILLCLIAPLLLLAAGCGSTLTYQFYPTYPDALKPPAPEITKVLSTELFDWDEIPEAQPYMVIYASGHARHGGGVRAIWKRAREFKADIVQTGVSDVYQSGSVSTYLGFGVYLNQPLYAIQSYGICYRLTPGRLGIRTDQDGLVQTIAPDSGFRETGLQEGDTILSIAGYPFASPGSSRWGAARALLRKQPGDELTLVWTRPGVGRMEGRGKLVQNDPTHLKLRDVIPVND